MISVTLVLAACAEQEVTTVDRTNEQFTKRELQTRLSDIQYHVTQEKGTERPYTGKYWNHKQLGTYSCVVCGQDLFLSDTKFDSGCGWPSYFKPINENCITEHRDTSLGMVRTEVVCSECGAHLGHVFPDGPPPTGLRYCINSASLNFRSNETPVAHDQPLAVGDTIPSIFLEATEKQPFDLRSSAAEQPLVLIFYRGGWCPYCTEHLRDLQSVEPNLRGLGFRILAISPDRPEKLKETTEKDELTYTLLSDSSMVAAKAFGLAFEVDASTLEKYKGYGIDLEEASGENHHMLPVPAVFIVDTAGTIRFAHSNPDYKVRLSGEKLLEAAREVAMNVQ